MIAPMMPPILKMPIMGNSHPAIRAADNADDDIPDEPETITLHDKTGEPTGGRANDKPNNQINEHGSLRVIAAGSSPATFIGHGGLSLCSA
jgi:hypothetical protein